MSGNTLNVEIGGLEEFIEQKIDEKLSAALDARADDPWLTSSEAAAYLGIAVSTLYDLISDGKLKKHGSRKTKIRLRRSELDAFVEGRTR
jgi:excisionase family DNA binding protein